eukprot:Skav214427  [mRNA]  locus=scaffold586:313094:316893:+ [translate_table: standard]
MVPLHRCLDPLLGQGAGSTEDVVFDSLALLFIFHLHEVQGGLAFVSVQAWRDFDEFRVGELCARIAEDDEKTEVTIYIILTLVPAPGSN